MLQSIAFFVLFSFASFAHAWQPTRPINVLIASGPGSGNDVAFLPVSRGFEALNIAHVVERMPGADGVVGANYFNKNGRPDGHGLMIYGFGQYAAAEILYKDTVAYSYDDFTLITRIAQTPFAILAKPNSRAGSIVELIADVASGSRTVGTSGAAHPFVWSLLAEKAGVPKGNLRFVNYRSPPPQLIDLARRDIDYGTAPLSTALPFYRDKRIAFVAVTSPRRMPGLPDVPAVAETIRGFEFVSDWGLVLPKGTSADIVRFYAGLIGKIVMGKDAQDYFLANSLSIGKQDLGPEEYRRHIEKARKQMSLPIAR